MLTFLIKPLLSIKLDDFKFWLSFDFLNIPIFLGDWLLRFDVSFEVVIISFNLQSFLKFLHSITFSILKLLNRSLTISSLTSLSLFVFCRSNYFQITSWPLLLLFLAILYELIFIAAKVRNATRTASIVAWRPTGGSLALDPIAGALHTAPSVGRILKQKFRWHRFVRDIHGGICFLHP